MEVQMVDFSQANSVLSKIRKNLDEESDDAGDAAWGPDDGQAVTGHLAGKPGSGGADNIEDMSNALDKYLTDIAEALMTKYELDEDEAYDFILYVASSLEDMGMLPTFPDEDAPAELYAEWYGKASSVKFDAAVMSDAAKELA